uniref:Tetratricopeptide repeat protein n=1 Tax=mine drainage metagenome TaxID=410659 RepID=E6QK80_9ZZZZ
MNFVDIRRFAAGLTIALTVYWGAAGSVLATAQSSSSSSSGGGAAQQQPGAQPGGNASGAGGKPTYKREKSPSLVDPDGPAISLVTSETLFTMAAALNACGYDDGLAQSDPIRQQLRDEVTKALGASEGAREKRDAVCLFIAQHKMTGTIKDVTQYISLSLYLTPPPELETSVELPEMPPDATQVVEILPVLRDFAAAVDLHGIWLTHHRQYDEIAAGLHDSLTKMILGTNYYLKMPVSTYDGRRFLVVVEPQLSPNITNARIYGADYVVVVSPHDGTIQMNNVRHTYLHYLIEPLLYQRSNAMDRFLPILKLVRDAPIDYQYRSEIVSLTIECLIKAIEARTMDTGIAPYVVPANATRADFEKIESGKNAVAERMERVRQARVQHDMRQGWVMTQYFYAQMVQFEKDPASLKDTIGELVYSMDVDHEQSMIRHIQFDQTADGDVLSRSAPRKLAGLDLAEARLEAGDIKTAASLAQAAMANPSATPGEGAGRANFILARVAVMSGHPNEAIHDFQKAITASKEPRIAAWSHIYLGRLLDLDCNRDGAVAEYKQALAVRDGQMDTRLAADRGVKAAYAVKGHVCGADTGADDDAPAPPAANTPSHPAEKPAGGDPVQAPQ